MDINEALAFLTLGGFAIQRSVELLDPVLEKVVDLGKKAGFDKGQLARWFAFGLGLIGANCASTPLIEGSPWLNTLVTGLVLGSGAEGLNTAEKYFSHVKDSRKAATLANSGAVRPI